MKTLNSSGPSSDLQGPPAVVDQDSEPLSTTLWTQLSNRFLALSSNPFQFREKDIVGDAAKGFAEVQINDTPNTFFIHCCSHSIIEGHQMGKNVKANGKK